MNNSIIEKKQVVEKEIERYNSLMADLAMTAVSNPAILLPGNRLTSLQSQLNSLQGLLNGAQERLRILEAEEQLYRMDLWGSPIDISTLFTVYTAKYQPIMMN